MSTSTFDFQSNINNSSFDDSTHQVENKPKIEEIGLKETKEKIDDDLLTINPFLYTTLSTATYNNKEFFRYLVPKNKPGETRICLLVNGTFSEDAFFLAIAFKTNKKDMYGFTTFNTPQDAYFWMMSLPSMNRNCFEVIRGGHQRPHFDIDVKDIADFEAVSRIVMKSLLSGIQSIMTSYGVPYDPNQHLLVFNSHGIDKRSYHIIIRGFFHENEKEAKAFYKLVVAYVPEELRDFVDSSVYKKNQQFRLLNNQKIGSGRIKRLDTEYTTVNIPSGSEHPDLPLFEQSIVGHIIGESMMLLSFIPAFETESFTHLRPLRLNIIDEIPIVPLTSRVLISSMEYYPTMVEAFNRSSLSDIYYIRNDCENGIINLSRKISAWCVIHNRTHDNDGGFLCISYNGDILFRCSRGSSDGYLKIGTIRSDLIKMSNEQFVGNKIRELASINGGIEVNRRNLVVEGDSINKVREVNGSIGMDGDSSNFISDIRESTEDLTIIDKSIVSVHKSNNNNASPGGPTTLINAKNENLIKSTQGSEPIRSDGTLPKSDHRSIESVKEESQVTNPQRRAKKRDLIAFINDHLIPHSGHVTELNVFADAYKLYCIHNNLSHNYHEKNHSGLSNVLARLTPPYITKRTSVGKTKIRVIPGYRLVRLDTLIDDSLQITPEDLPHLTNPNPDQPIVSIYDEMWIKYEALTSNRLPGPQTVDNSPRMPHIQSLVGDLIRYVLALKGPCGLGKTEEIKYYFSILESLSRTKKLRFLCICGRIGLSQKQIDDFKSLGVEYYQNFKGIIKNIERLIVTIDSLYRVQGHYDFIILDEVSYTFAQLVTFSHEKDKNSQALIERIRRTDKIILADAYLSNTTLILFRKLRDDIIIYENNYPIHADKTVNVFENGWLWFANIFDEIKEGKKLAICCGSKDNIAVTLKNILDPLCKVSCYTSDSGLNGDPTRTWTQYDVVIYSSVLEAGNSFMELHFDAVYGSFTTWSFGPESAAQMVYRARQTHTGMINIYVHQSGWNDKFPSYINTYSEACKYILQQAMDIREDLFAVIRMSYVESYIDETHPYIDIYTDIKFRENIGKRNYLWSFLRLLKNGGVKWGNYIDDAWYQDKYGLSDDEFKGLLSEIKDTIKTERYAIKDNRHKDICTVYDINYEHAQLIKAQINPSRQEKLALLRYKLRERFQMDCCLKELPAFERGPGLPTIINEPIMTPSYIAKVINKLPTHTNAKLCMELSCDDDDLIAKMEHVKELMESDEHYEILDATLISEGPHRTPISELVPKSNRRGPDPSKRLHHTKKIIRYRICMHTINILRLLGCKRWLETYHKYDARLQFRRSLEHIDVKYHDQLIDEFEKAHPNFKFPRTRLLEIETQLLTYFTTHYIDFPYPHYPLPNYVNLAPPQDRSRHYMQLINEICRKTFGIVFKLDKSKTCYVKYDTWICDGDDVLRHVSLFETKMVTWDEIESIRKAKNPSLNRKCNLVDNNNDKLKPIIVPPTNLIPKSPIIPISHPTPPIIKPLISSSNLRPKAPIIPIILQTKQSLIQQSIFLK